MVIEVTRHLEPQSGVISLAYPPYSLRKALVSFVIGFTDQAHPQRFKVELFLGQQRSCSLPLKTIPALLKCFELGFPLQGLL